MACFRQDYLDLLDGRITKITGLVAAQQDEPARVALLSLESSSAMVGADDLRDVVKRLRSALEQGGSDDELDQLTQEMTDVAEGVQQRLGRQA